MWNHVCCYLPQQAPLGIFNKDIKDLNLPLPFIELLKKIIINSAATQQG